MTACPDDVAWSALLAEELSEERRESLERHLDDCEACRQRLFDMADGRADPVGPRLPSVPGYRLVAEAGRGGMGVVYKAVRPGEDRPLAVKVLSSSGKLSAAHMARAARECQALSRLDHPNIVRAIDVGEADGAPYLVMEWVDGGDLATKIRAYPLSPRDAAQMAYTLAGAVAAAHAAGILHRDLKPGNVLIGADRSPRLTDFDLARPVEATDPLTSTGSVLGTPAYMAPEGVDPHFGPVGPPSDVYGLGATLYAMLTGLPPFRGANPVQILRQVVGRDPVAPRTVDAAIPPDLEAICLKCLEKRPRRRYPSAEALAADLARYLDGRRPAAARGASIRRAASMAIRRPAAVAVAALALGAAGSWVASLDVQRRRAEAREAESARLLGEAIRGVDDALAATSFETLRGTPGATEFERTLREDFVPFLSAYLRDRPDSRPWSGPEVRMLFELAIVHMNGGREAEALEYLRRCADVGHPFLRSHPDESDAAATVSVCENWLATIAHNLGGPPSSLPHVERCYQAALNIRVEDLGRPGLFYYRTVAQTNLGGTYLNAGRIDDAMKVEDEGLAFDRKANKVWPSDAAIEIQLVSQLHRIARLRITQHSIDDAAPLLDEGRDRLARLTAAGAKTFNHKLPDLYDENADLRSQLARADRR